MSNPPWRLESWNKYRRAHLAENLAHVLAYQRRKRENTFARDGYRCHYCGMSQDEGAVLTIDHKRPFSRGGTDGPQNRITACRTCNARKFTKTYAEFMRQLEAERLARNPDALPSFVTEENPLALEEKRR